MVKKKSWLGKAKGKECKWQNLWKKGCFVSAGVGVLLFEMFGMFCNVNVLDV